MSIVSQIRDGAVNGDVSIATVLRQCAVLAARVDNEGFRGWVARELNGYPSDVELPSYRVLPAPAHGHLTGPFGSGYKNITIPPAVMPKGTEEYAQRVYL